jgi:phosphopantothenoylcysteine decarboxylase/phosphopantothenate--cysteine ligase
LIGPEEGSLADGEWGMGRMASLDAIVTACASLVGLAGAHLVADGAGNGRPLDGRTIVVTAGGTEEPIDPVRVITNRSSGKMGFAIAAEARDLGARVRLIIARTTADPPAGVERIDAPTAASMADAVLRAVKDADALVMAAAVSDFTPTKPSGSKLPREGSGMKLDLAPTTDILKEVRAAHPGKLLVGFALETEDEINRGRGKMQRKGLDLVAVNNPGKPGSAFGSDTNDVTLIDSDGRVEALGLRPKREVARAILLRVAKALNQD